MDSSSKSQKKRKTKGSAEIDKSARRKSSSGSKEKAKLLKSDESSKRRKKSDDSVRKKKSDESLRKKRSEESLRKKKSDESLRKKKSDESFRKKLKAVKSKVKKSREEEEKSGFNSLRNASKRVAKKMKTFVSRPPKEKTMKQVCERVQARKEKQSRVQSTSSPRPKLVDGSACYPRRQANKMKKKKKKRPQTAADVFPDDEVTCPGFMLTEDAGVACCPSPPHLEQISTNSSSNKDSGCSMSTTTTTTSTGDLITPSELMLNDLETATLTPMSQPRPPPPPPPPPPVLMPARKKSSTVLVMTNKQNGGNVIVNGKPFWTIKKEGDDDDDDDGDTDDELQLNADVLLDVQSGKIRLVPMPNIPVTLEPLGDITEMPRRDAAFFQKNVLFGNTVRTMINLSEVPSNENENAPEYEHTELLLEPPVKLVVYKRGDFETTTEEPYTLRGKHSNRNPPC